MTVGELLQFGQSELFGCELEVDILAELAVDGVLRFVPAVIC